MILMVFIKGQIPWNKNKPEEPNEYIDNGDHIVMFIRRKQHPDIEVLLDKSVHERIRNVRWFVAGKYGYNDYVWRKDIGKLHRHILGFSKGDARTIDHINRNRFDNRLVNLRIVDGQIENMKNHSNYSNNRSGHNGVYFVNDLGKYIAYIGHNNEHYHLGTFSTLEEACNARTQAESRYWHKNINDRA